MTLYLPISAFNLISIVGDLEETPVHQKLHFFLYPQPTEMNFVFKNTMDVLLIKTTVVVQIIKLEVISIKITFTMFFSVDHLRCGKGYIRRECREEFGGLRTYVSNLSSTVGTKGLSSQELRWVESYSQRSLLSGVSLRTVTFPVTWRHPKTDSFYFLVLWEVTPLFLADDAQHFRISWTCSVSVSCVHLHILHTPSTTKT